MILCPHFPVLAHIDECRCQLGRSKNIIQIELNESLRRRRDELHSQIEGLGEPEVGDANAADDLKVRTHEINSVNNAINTLTKKVQGLFPSALPVA
jgi:structural maintenance of chromosome 3 (chondroitin sulfate proteoglycan 6)